MRISRRADVALLRPSRPIAPQRCLGASASSEPAIGAEVYAVGAPAKVEVQALVLGSATQIPEVPSQGEGQDHPLDLPVHRNLLQNSPGRLRETDPIPVAEGISQQHEHHPDQRRENREHEQRREPA